MSTVNDTRPEDRDTTLIKLQTRVEGNLCDHIWNGPRISVDGDLYSAMDPDEVPGMDEFDVVLRGPDGTLWDVEIEVSVSRRAAQATT